MVRFLFLLTSFYSFFFSPYALTADFYHILEPDVVVNLKSNSFDKLHYIRVKVAFHSSGEAKLKSIELHEPLLRESLLNCLTNLDFQDLITKDNVYNYLETHCLRVMNIRNNGIIYLNKIIFMSVIYI